MLGDCRQYERDQYVQNEEMGGGGVAQLSQIGFNVEYNISNQVRCKQCKVMSRRSDLRMGKLFFYINVRGLYLPLLPSRVPVLIWKRTKVVK